MGKVPEQRQCVEGVGLGKHGDKNTPWDTVEKVPDACLADLRCRTHRGPEARPTPPQTGPRQLPDRPRQTGAAARGARATPRGPPYLLRPSPGLPWPPHSPCLVLLAGPQSARPLPPHWVLGIALPPCLIPASPDSSTVTGVPLGLAPSGPYSWPPGLDWARGGCLSEDTVQERFATGRRAAASRDWPLGLQAGRVDCCWP